MSTIKLVSVSLLLVLFVGCDNISGPETAQEATLEVSSAHVSSQTLVANSTNHFETSFTATALCGSPIGDIRFTGTIRGTDHTTTDQNGETHRTRQFRVRGLTGLNLATGATYTVQGGAEMLTWNTQIGQVPGVPAQSIHAGTLVFNPDEGGARVVAHHAIRYVENAEEEIVVDYHDWSCRTSNGN